MHWSATPPSDQTIVRSRIRHLSHVRLFCKHRRKLMLVCVASNTLRYFGIARNSY